MWVCTNQQFVVLSTHIPLVASVSRCEAAARRLLLCYPQVIHNPQREPARSKRYDDNGMSQKPRTYIYIDGFNFYYGCIKRTPFRWLNIAQMCSLLLPKNDIQQIRYFTAPVTARPSDPDQAVRQQIYFRALKTLPNFDIILGHFLTKETDMPSAPITTPVSMVRVMKTEEKGSDVNLGSHLLRDGFQNRFDVAVVITNDSDLTTPIQMVRADLAKIVGIINPHQYPSFQLRNNCDFMKPIRRGVLKASLFSDQLTDTDGTFTKPKGW